MSYCITDAFVLRNHQLIKEDLWVHDGKIVPGPLNSFYSISLPSKIISPGFIDIQVNGAYGFDFTTEPEGIFQAAKKLPLTGVTSFLAAIISSPSKHYHKVLQKIHAQSRLKTSDLKAHFLGVHLEGPFFNPEKIGAHPKEYVPSLDSYPISSDFIKEYYGYLDDVKIITLAPELPGILQLIAKLHSDHIILSAGHSLASFKEANESFKAGIKMVTHLFNAMGSLEQREPGLIGAVLKSIKSNRPIFYSLISDGLHVHPAMIEIAWKTNPEGCILISDGIAPLGLNQSELQSQKKFSVGFEKVSYETGINQISGKATLAGGTTPLNQCVKKFIETTGCSIVEGLETVTLKPAQLLEIQSIKGTLNFGADADFVILDQDLNVIDVFIQGNRL